MATEIHSGGGPRELLAQQIRQSFKPIAWLMDDPEITDIFVYGPADISYIRCGQKRVQASANWGSEKDLRIAVSQLGRYLKRKVDERSPVLDSRLPDGSRVNVVIDPCYPLGVCMTIRKFPKIRITASDLIRLGTIDRRGLDILQDVIHTGENVLISGGTGSGKTTLLNILASFIGENESVVSIEDAREIQLENRFWAALEKKEASNQDDTEVSIRDLLKNALRMNPRWIIVGEIRGEEVIDLMRGFNTGHAGISTIHANSCRDALLALEVLMMSFTNQRVEAIRSMLSRVIHVVVQLHMASGQLRQVTDISRVKEVSFASGIPEIVMEALYSQGPGDVHSRNGDHEPERASA